VTNQGLPLDALAYRLRFKPRRGAPGAHKGIGEGSEGQFLRNVPLVHQFDPRRIDLSTSLRDPFGGLYTRTYAPRRAVPIVVVADLSASMGFGIGTKSTVRLAEFARLIAISAYANGDSFGLICADTKVEEEMFIPASRRSNLAEEVFSRLVASKPNGRNARGLIDAASFLPKRRSLVFLVSDFLMPLADVAAILESLLHHDVVPIVIRHEATDGELPSFGFAIARDLETGRERLLFLRPSLRAAWRRATADRLAALEHLFATHGRRAFHLVDPLDVDALAEYLVAA
jgi:uncharacterized protein (DUF58 family)